MPLQKWIIIIKPKVKFKVDDNSLKKFSRYILKDIAVKLNHSDIAKIKVSLTEEKAPKFNLFGFKDEAIAIIHLWGTAAALEASKLEAENFKGYSFAFYNVNEMVAKDYEDQPLSGSKTAMPLVVTLLKKQPEISIEEFKKYWHTHYTPLAMSIIPIWLYFKNEIIETLSDSCDMEIVGIVEETCSNKKDLLNPIRFFAKGNVLKLIPNLLKISKGVKSFLDLKKLQVYYLHEYYIKA